MKESMTAPEFVRVPWTGEQVRSLNEYQSSGVFHPYTGNNELAPDGEDDVLVATNDGWVSKVDPTYTQGWAWGWTADYSWKEGLVWKRGT